MNDSQIQDLETMTNKLIEYVWTVDSEQGEIEYDLLSIAAKCVLASFSKRGEYACRVTLPELADRCSDVLFMCMGGGEIDGK